MLMNPTQASVFLLLLSHCVRVFSPCTNIYRLGQNSHSICTSDWRLQRNGIPKLDSDTIHRTYLLVTEVTVRIEEFVH